MFRAIEVTAPPGTIANGVLPAACAARGLTGFRMVDCMFGALAKMLPDQVFAASDGGNTGISIGGWHGDRQPFIYVDFTCCAWGARPYADGLDGNSHIYANMASQPIEVTETEQPLQITAYEFIQDAMGPGKFRGGAPFRREYRLSGRRGDPAGALRPARFPPVRALWRRPGQAVDELPEPGYGEPGPLPSKLTMTMQARRPVPPRGRRRRRLGRPAGARPGAGAARRAERIRQPAAAAREDYGVVLSEAPLAVDEAATRASRQRLGRERNWPQTPAISWEPSPGIAMAAE